MYVSKLQQNEENEKKCFARFVYVLLSFAILMIAEIWTTLCVCPLSLDKVWALTSKGAQEHIRSS